MIKSVSDLILAIDFIDGTDSFDEEEIKMLSSTLNSLLSKLLKIKSDIIREIKPLPLNYKQYKWILN